MLYVSIVTQLEPLSSAAWPVCLTRLWVLFCACRCSLVLTGPVNLLLCCYRQLKSERPQNPCPDPWWIPGECQGTSHASHGAFAAVVQYASLPSLAVCITGLCEQALCQQQLQ